MEEFWKFLGGKLFYFFIWIVPCIFIAFGLGLIRKEKFPAFFDRFLGSILLLGSSTFFIMSKGESALWLSDKKEISLIAIIFYKLLAAPLFIFLDSFLLVLGLCFLLEKFGMHFSWKKVWGFFLILYGLSGIIFSIEKFNFFS